MPWLGIWFEHGAGDGAPRDPAMFEGLVRPVAYPFARNFIEGETKRLLGTKDPGYIRSAGERYSVYYSLAHSGGQTGIDQQGCRVLQWLFENFDPKGRNDISKRFSEIPVVIHAIDPKCAAAMGNALTLLRFLGAAEDQAIAKMVICPWNPQRGNARLAALDYEKRVLEFLHDDIFYPEDVTLFDVLSRRDLKAHRSLSPCCDTQIGFVRPLLEWIDECWPKTQEEALELEGKLRNSLGDEASYLKKTRRQSGKSSTQRMSDLRDLASRY
jgi:hypothetical protein